ncbi:hypothetical protein [Streptomyces sp. NPDC088707]|uniref:hypothetical protein n=1 Tax=Streptomyces sp. NPDC088707 TaxID=3365871 RepID=UPI0037F45D2E
MTTETYAVTVTDARALLTAGQNAVRAVEEYGSPATVRGLDTALCAFPLIDDQAHRAVTNALRAVSLAKDAETWAVLDKAERAVSSFIHTPDSRELGDAAILAVAELAVHATHRSNTAIGGSAVRRAWDRAHRDGATAIQVIVSAVSGSADGRALDGAMTKLFGSIRRAVPYFALVEVRLALVEFARSHGLFVVGMRQPMPDGDWEYARRLGGAVYLFRVDPPSIREPYGAVVVQRIAEDGSGGTVRSFGLYSFGERRTALNDALSRI